MKRIFDFTVAIIALTALSIPLLIIFFCVRVFLGQPVIFKQVRPGLHGRPFTMYKFRTMTNKTDLNGHLLPDAMRLTRFGKFLRSTSLDELPELWNVITGDMSIVGPRPLLMEYLPLYSKTQFRRHEVPPGITGWAQINGRNAIGWEEKFKLDIWYIENRSLALDLKIIFLTVLKVFRRDNINTANGNTMEPFKGNLT